MRRISLTVFFIGNDVQVHHAKHLDQTTYGFRPNRRWPFLVASCPLPGACRLRKGSRLGVEEDKSEAIYWLTCAGSSDDGSAMSARRLKDRLLRSLPTAERKAADRSAASCPRALTVEGEESGFDLFGFGDSRPRRTARHDEGFTGSMQEVRGNGVVSLFLLPGEATLAAGRETASFLGAKQVAYAIDSTRDPGNDILYLLVVFFSWFLLYKLVRGAYVLWQKFSEVAIIIEVRNDGRSALPRRKHGDHENA
jgi:hypothetical protein